MTNKSSNVFTNNIKSHILKKIQDYTYVNIPTISHKFSIIDINIDYCKCKGDYELIKIHIIFIPITKSCHLSNMSIIDV